ncbi:MAG: Glu-tRNA(Gln) amidotransferase GatDE subunit E, partial [Candidatus Diapherotrites archaeon]|nr:Glu-tRNA(Gln) amidotransferase GatDE subunit E [Candidatus Diapherotrites archaeon]
MPDFKQLGLKAGLEVHQQLDTGKLFCRCPSRLREDKPDIIFERKLRAVASELGEFDAAALEAMRKNITFFYEGYS